MFWWLFGSLLNSLSSVWYKKALVEASAQGASSLMVAWAMNLNALLLLVLSLAIPAFQRIANVGFGWSFELHPELYAVFAGISLLWLTSGLLGQYAYANEKISVLAPFAESKQLLTIVLGFLFLGNGTSLFTFLMAVIAGATVVGGSLDFRTFTINRYCWSLALGGLLRAVSAIGIAYVLSFVSPVTFVLTDLTITSGLLCIGFAYSRWKAVHASTDTEERRFFPAKPVRILRELSINNALWLGSYAIGLTLVKNLWLVASTLIAMTGMMTTMAVSALILRDMPTKKSLAIATIVIACIVFGSIYGK